MKEADRMYKQINLQIGGRIREKRQVNKLTLESIGISPQFLGDVERGKKSLSYSNLQKLCEVLCVSADYLLCGKMPQTEFPSITDVLQTIPPGFLPIVEEAIHNTIRLIAQIRKIH